MTSVPKIRATRRVQYAALPYRQRQDGEIQIRLITSRETRRWVIPKGWPMKGFSPSKAAAREAYEEAGLLGSISTTPLGLYSYEKRLTLQTVPCDVMVFPLKVKRYVKKWPERSERFGFWFSVESAAAAVQEPELSQLIIAFGDLMAARFAQKRSRHPVAAGAAQAGDAASSADAGTVTARIAKRTAGKDTTEKHAAKAKGASKPKVAASAPEPTESGITRKVPTSPKPKGGAKDKAVAKMKGPEKGTKGAADDGTPPQASGKSEKSGKAKGKVKGERTVLVPQEGGSQQGWTAGEEPPRIAHLEQAILPPTRH